MITKQMLDRLWPEGDSRVPGLRDGIVSKAASVFAKYGLTSDLLIAHAMAQFSHECGAGTEMVENLNYSADGLQKTWPGRFDAVKANAYAHKPQDIANVVYNGRMGNRVGTDDGWEFRGRGLSQCTGREGYQKLGKKVGLDLLSNPDLINDPTNALECGVADFILCGCLDPAKQDDVVSVTRRLNGGTIGLSQRKEWLAKWKDALAGANAAFPQPPDVEPVQKPAPKKVSKHVAAGTAAGGAATVAYQLGFPIWVIPVVAIVVAAVVYLIVKKR